MSLLYYEDDDAPVSSRRTDWNHLPRTPKYISHAVATPSRKAGLEYVQPRAQVEEMAQLGGTATAALPFKNDAIKTRSSHQEKEKKMRDFSKEVDGLVAELSPGIIKYVESKTGKTLSTMWKDPIRNLPIIKGLVESDEFADIWTLPVEDLVTKWLKDDPVFFEVYCKEYDTIYKAIKKAITTITDFPTLFILSMLLKLPAAEQMEKHCVAFLSYTKNRIQKAAQPDALTGDMGFVQDLAEPIQLAKDLGDEDPFFSSSESLFGSDSDSDEEVDSLSTHPIESRRRQSPELDSLSAYPIKPRLSVNPIEPRRRQSPEVDSLPTHPIEHRRRQPPIRLGDWIYS